MIDASSSGAPQRIRVSPEQLYTMAVQQQRDGRLSQAANLYRAVIALDPTAILPRLGMGQVLWALGAPHEASAALMRALALEPADGPGLRLLAMIEARQENVCTSVLLGKRAFALEPKNLDTRLSLAQTLLGMGALTEGWAHYLARPSTRLDPNPFNRNPLSRDLRGRRLLVVADQGLGDEIFFLRFVPRLKAAGAWITYRAHPKIADIVGRLPFLDHVSTRSAEDPTGLDTLLSVGDLPHLTAAYEEPDYPASIQLTPLPNRVAAAEASLAALGPPPYIGVTWRAGVVDMQDKRAPLEALAAALAGCPGTILSLQRHPEEGEVAAFSRAVGRPVPDCGPLNEDLEEMLALLSRLDEVVGVSNTNTHLRAALGLAARVLVPFPAEFRWAGDELNSPWFPGFTLYRQRLETGWAGALERLRCDLYAAWTQKDSGA